MLKMGDVVRRTVIALAGLLAGCSSSPTTDAGRVTNMKKPKIEDVLDRNTGYLMGIAGVEAVGLGGDTAAPVILVMVRGNQAEMVRKLPKEVEGHPVKVEVTGEIRAH